MPTNVVKTKEDEALWSRAKAIVKEQYGSVRWPLVMSIYRKLKKG